MTDSSIFHGPCEPPILNLSIANMLDAQARRHGDRLAISALHQGAKYTYSTLRERVRERASQLLNSGVRSGDRIILLAGNCVEYVDVFLAVAAVGAISVLIAPGLALSEVQNAVQSVEPVLLFVAAKIGYRSNTEILKWAVSNLSVNVIVLGGDGQGHNNDMSTPSQGRLVTFGQFAQGHATAFRLPFVEKGGNVDAMSLSKVWSGTLPSSPCCFQFTSGTTGPRKASMLSQSNLINNANLVGYRLKLEAADKMCCIPPLSHCFGLVGGLLASLLHGSSLILPSEIFNPPQALKAMLSEGCTHIIAVPSMFDALIKQEKKRLQIENGASVADYKLRSGMIAGATPPLSILHDLKALFSLEKLLYPFGMTELSAVSICTTLEDSLLEDNSSVGTAMPHTSIKIIDENGVTCPLNVPGELCVSGYLVHLGYFRNEAKTEEAIHTDESGKPWFRTGDIVVIDSTGRCRVAGRSKDMIKKHGENIIPRDIEDLLAAHDSVKTSAVVGVPSDKHGESIVAFVERHDRGVADERQLKTFLRERGLPPHKMPDLFMTVGNGPSNIGVMTEFPLNASGKILKTELRRHASASIVTG